MAFYSTSFVWIVIWEPSAGTFLLTSLGREIRPVILVDYFDTRDWHPYHNLCPFSTRQSGHRKACWLMLTMPLCLSFNRKLCSTPFASYIQVNQQICILFYFELVAIFMSVLPPEWCFSKNIAFNAKFKFI